MLHIIPIRIKGSRRNQRLSQFKFFWSLTAESSLLPVEEQACFKILSFRSESGCFAATDIVRIKTGVLDH